ncbi:AlpA family transcriptional regulator [Jannaschia sp. W003]|uniref:helix-turn-helix transcriptional regulator n=1 Tax=Jannaschia sp. W003 TaxID=2867012 RepID=UPI0021A3BBBD|nr:AlpA family transcriptional regulator [Jannaschia sp. W003]UWQ22401.1 AlpA family transcriptional regulator [Jannaschia sp. W003]
MTKIHRRAELEQMLGISRSTIYAWLKAGRFPPPLRLGERAVGWRASDIEAWLAERAPAGATGPAGG